MYHFYHQGGKDIEYCFNIETSQPLTDEELKTLRFILAEGFLFDGIKEGSVFSSDEKIIELGPRINFATALSTNAVSICNSCGLEKVKRIELSRRHNLATDANEQEFIKQNHDAMTECQYKETLNSFETGIKPEKILGSIL